MSIIVQKYGGTSVADPERISAVADRIVATRRDPEVSVSIVDEGAGIALEDREHMFEPFYTTKSSGTGLGLAMTQQIVDEHHGRLSVESTIGTGTIFTITLPRG